MSRAPAELSWAPTPAMSGQSTSERAVDCCGCGGRYSVAECRHAALPAGGFAFSCSPGCEELYEDRRAGRAPWPEFRFSPAEMGGIWG